MNNLASLFRLSMRRQYGLLTGTQGWFDALLMKFSSEDASMTLYSYQDREQLCSE